MREDTRFFLLIAVFAILSIGMLLYGMVWVPYKKEWDYITMEIHRSDKEEREYWRKKRRNLYKRYLPVGRKQEKRYPRR